MHDERDGDKVRPFPAAGNPGSPAPAPLPPGKLEMVITYLEMRRAPPPRPLPRRAESLSILRARRPTVSYYRYLYDTVGGPWMWFERRRMDDATLAATVRDPRVGVHVMYVDGVPAGYAELDARTEGEIELAYFGLVPEFIGRGLGHYLLEWAVAKAWDGEPSRVWVHTCNFDHPAALAAYQRAGFLVYDQERRIIDDPR
jgi:GNAT superfamily N-acetyltransferase